MQLYPSALQPLTEAGRPVHQSSDSEQQEESVQPEGKHTHPYKTNTQWTSLSKDFYKTWKCMTCMLMNACLWI